MTTLCSLELGVWANTRGPKATVYISGGIASKCVIFVGITRLSVTKAENSENL
jgi:hypothetical protein